MQSDQVTASILTKGQLYPVKHTKRGCDWQRLENKRDSLRGKG